MRQAARVAEVPRPPHAPGRAAGPIGVGRERVDPEPERDAERVRRRLRQRDGRVHATGHRDRQPAAARHLRAAGDGVAEGGVERVHRHLDAAGARTGDAARAVCVVGAEARRVEQAPSLGRVRQPGGRRGRGRARIGAEPDRRDAPVLQREREPHAVVAGPAAGTPLAVGSLDGSGPGEVDHATLSTARRSPLRAAANAVRNASTSASVVAGPRVTRTAPRAAAGSIPIADST